MRSFSDATYITVGDASGQRLYHVNPDEIGKSMEGGDSDEALINAKSYVSVRKARWDRRCAVNRRFRTQPAR
ncbi:signal transduction histidine kinase regulating citrate/malate metabolism [Klebsiella pneumoniae]|uniref:Signal transduction histidine kinase regulating citrate/malate metabolism n=1 Tax=Klebsiella pneumoniae TaxID=573 RepID=A0A2X3CQA5_KLEPN|nr:signal transduction histidine kinase regulating citrate/malate metabolism [Klebsiella pneumoniae]